jgi:hypothetical protein
MRRALFAAIVFLASFCDARAAYNPQAPNLYTYAGNPNGHVAGYATTGGSPPDLVYDTTDFVYYVCTTTGNAAAAVWTPVTQFGAVASVASASTTDLGAQTSHTLSVTGTTTITSFGSSATTANPIYILNFTGALTLTYNGTSMVLPGNASITTAAGDVAIAYYVGSGNWKVLSYSTQSGLPVISPNQVVGTQRGLKASLTSAGTSLAFTADGVVTVTALNGRPYEIPSFSQTVNTAGTGIGGMDTGSAPTNGFVSIYAAYNPTTATAGIFACNVTTSASSVYGGANLPSGYSATALIGIWPTNGSGQFVPGLIADPLGRKFSYTTYSPIFTGHANITTFTSQTLSTAVPPSAKFASFYMGTTNTTATIATVAVAADASGTGGQNAIFTNYSSTGVAIGGGIPAQAGGVSFKDVAIVTAQTVYVISNTGSNFGNLYLTDYSW